MPPLVTASVAEQTVAVLRDAIMRGDLAPGVRYSVEAIAKQLQLGVSRTPVREALVRLSEAGMVKVEPKRGFQIIKRNVHDVEELFQMRLMLEVPATYRAARAVDTTTLRKLRDQFDAMDMIASKRCEMSTRNRSDPSLEELDLEFAKRDAEFHEQILEAAGNKTLVADVRDIRYRITALGAWKLSMSRDEGLPEVQEEHKLLLDALESQNPQAAATAMYNHLVKTGETMSQLVEARGQGSFNPEWCVGVVVPTIRQGAAERAAAARRDSGRLGVRAGRSVARDMLESAVVPSPQ
jgi:DNA-binding GntR family transcriptional regulator